MSEVENLDLVVIGSGPGGQKAAIAAAKAGARTAIVESSREVGGACVRYGTIPSKTLRQIAISWLHADRLRPEERTAGRALPLNEMKSRVEAVAAKESATVLEQLRRNGVRIERGRGSFESPHRIAVTTPRGARTLLEAEHVILATGSAPRELPQLRVDHERVLDSDSILSLGYLPESLVVLGGGVIACEYASIFAAMGSQVTLVDRGSRPLSFLSEELSQGFLQSFARLGGQYLGEVNPTGLCWDGFSHMQVLLEGDRMVEAEKVLLALGRAGCVAGLELEKAGLSPNGRSLLDVDSHFRTAVPHIYAVGDLAGPPALATTAMEQGRLAAEHALGISTAEPPGGIPIGIYTIPDIATVGVGGKMQGLVCGTARFEELARSIINGDAIGRLTLFVERDTGRLRGVEILGEGATDLVHIGQMAILGGLGIEDLIANPFNFPTMAEAYRVAALDARARREQRRV